MKWVSKKVQKDKHAQDLFQSVMRHKVERTSWKAPVKRMSPQRIRTGWTVTMIKRKGCQKRSEEKKEGSRREMGPRKPRRVKQGHITTWTLQSKHRRKRKAEAKQARKTIRLKTKRFQREKKKKRQFVIHLPVEIRLPAELLLCGGLCQKIQ